MFVGVPAYLNLPEHLVPRGLNRWRQNIFW
jgi:hypothetical protein